MMNTSLVVARQLFTRAPAAGLWRTHILSRMGKNYSKEERCLSLPLLTIDNGRRRHCIPHLEKARVGKRNKRCGALFFCSCGWPFVGENPRGRLTLGENHVIRKLGRRGREIAIQEEILIGKPRSQQEALIEKIAISRKEGSVRSVEMIARYKAIMIWELAALT